MIGRTWQSMFSHRAPKGYRVGEPHPTAKGDIYGQSRQEEPSIPHAGRYTGFKRMVSDGIGGLQGVCDGTADASNEQGH